MRFDNYLLNENKRYDETLKQLEQVIKKCSQFFGEVGSSGFLYRGTKIKIKAPVEIRIPRKDRKPLNTDDIVHETMDSLFLKNFGWRARSQGVFCSPNIRTVKCYGIPYIIIPANGYKYIYSKNWADYGDMIDIIDDDFSDFKRYHSYKLDSNIIGDYNYIYGVNGKFGEYASDSFDKTFNDLDKLNNFMDKRGYYTNSAYGNKRVIYYSVDEKPKVTWEWVFPKKIPTRQEYKQQKEEYLLEKYIEYIEQTAIKYFKNLQTTGLKNIIKTELASEVMLKCKHYYLIDVDDDLGFEDLIRQYY